MTDGNRTSELEPDGESRQSLVDMGWDVVPAGAEGIAVEPGAQPSSNDDERSTLIGVAEPLVQTDADVATALRAAVTQVTVAAGDSPASGRPDPPTTPPGSAQPENDLFTSMLDADEPPPRPWPTRRSEPPRMRSASEVRAVEPASGVLEAAEASAEAAPAAAAHALESRPAVDVDRGVGPGALPASDVPSPADEVAPDTARGLPNGVLGVPIEPEGATSAMDAAEASVAASGVPLLRAEEPFALTPPPALEEGMAAVADTVGPSVVVAPIAVVGDVVSLRATPRDGADDSSGLGQVEPDYGVPPVAALGTEVDPAQRLPRGFIGAVEGSAIRSLGGASEDDGVEAVEVSAHAEVPSIPGPLEDSIVVGASTAGTDPTETALRVTSNEGAASVATVPDGALALAAELSTEAEASSAETPVASIAAEPETPLAETPLAETPLAETPQAPTCVGPESSTDGPPSARGGASASVSPPADGSAAGASAGTVHSSFGTAKLDGASAGSVAAAVAVPAVAAQRDAAPLSLQRAGLGLDENPFRGTAKRQVPLVMAAGLALVAMGLGAVLGAAYGSSDGAAESVSGAAPRLSATAAVPPRSLLDRAEDGEEGALAELERLPAASRSLVQALALAKGQAARAKLKFETLARETKQNPSLAQQPATQARLIEAAKAPETALAALQAIAELRSTTAADMLYELWTGTVERTMTTTTAEILVTTSELRATASPALRVALDLRASAPEACDEKVEILQRLKKYGDDRSAHLVNKLLRRFGCGPKGQNDCHACLRGTPLLKDAVYAVRERKAPQF